MRQRSLMIRLIVALCLLPAFVLGRRVIITAQQPAALNCVYLPFISTGGGASEIVPGQGQGESIGCPSTPTSGELFGTVRLLPEYVQTPSALRVPRYLLVLDASGSMSANFHGQCNNTGMVVQCTNGPPGAPPIQVTGVGPTYYWENQTERRISVAKQALERLARLTNMPGNLTYNPALPHDQMAVVWFNESAPSANARDFSSDPTSIVNFITTANNVDGNYRSQGGTNGAAGLYRAVALLRAAPTSVIFNAQTYTYENHVIFITDGVSNQFLNRSASNLWGGQSSASTYAVGNPCRSLGEMVGENAACQTTDVGGIYNGWDRPITQMVQVSMESFHSGMYGPTSVDVVALSTVPSTGLRAGVSSLANTFFVAESLTTYVDGTTNVDTIIDMILARSQSRTCVPGPGGVITDTIMPDQFVDGTNGLVYPQVGAVSISNSTETFTAPIIAAADGRLSYRFADVPPGSYQLEAYLYYHHPLEPFSVVRLYSQIWHAEESQASLPITVSAAPPLREQPLTLRMSGNVCP